MNNSFLKLINKKVIFTIITSSAFISACTFTVIWLYLSNIERLDILYDAISFTSAIGIVFGFTLVSLLAFSLLIFISSFILYLIYSANEKEYAGYNGMAMSLSTTCCINSIALCLVLIGGFCLNYFLKINGYVVFVISLIAMPGFSFWITRKNILRKSTYLIEDNQRSAPFLQTRIMKISLPLLLIIPAFVQIFPILFITRQLDFVNGGSEPMQVLLFTFMTIALITLGIFPGMIIINEKKNKGLIQVIAYTLIIIPVGILILSLVFRPTPNMILNMTMNLSGISDWRTHQYYIKTTTHPHAMFDGALWNTRYHNDIPDRFFITGVNIFSLGDIRLICPTAITHARSFSLKFVADRLDEYDARLNDLKNTAMKCIVFNKEDIHTWDSPISEPIFYQKVKLSHDTGLIQLLHLLK